MNLDDLDFFATIDPAGFIHHIDALPDQVTAAWAAGRSFSLPGEFHSATHVLILGRGDSAIAGDIAQAAAGLEARLPVTLWSGRGLPGWVGPETVVVALSHSGNTPDTVNAAAAALARGASVLAITTGGRLATLDGAAIWRYEHDGDARTAVGHLTLLTLSALTRLGVVSDKSADVAEAAEALKAQQVTLRADSPVSHNPAKRMAGQLMGRYAVLCVVDDLAPAGRRWQGLINQTAKAWAQCLPLAEADHAVAGMLFPEPLVSKYMLLFLRGAQETPQTRLRTDAARLAFMTNGFNTDAISAVGRSNLAQMLTLLHYGDYVAYYLAMCYGVDPTPVPRIE